MPRMSGRELANRLAAIRPETRVLYMSGYDGAEAPRRRAAWPKELTAAVEAALAQEQSTPPKGVRAADWERVLATRRDERETLSAAALRRLGPQVGPEQIQVEGDEVLVRQPKKRQFHELRTARVATGEGSRYLSGTGGDFLLVLAQNQARLEELIAHLAIREESPVKYREQWVKREYIGSGGVEKANDLIVARRMKRRGMHCSLETALRSDAWSHRASRRR